MKYLVDTHLLLWAAITDGSLISSGSLSKEAKQIMDDMGNELFFSAAAVWEVAIKNALAKPEFQVDARVFRRGLLDNGYIELPITSEHAAAVANLDDIHNDPFDRIQIAQATEEGIMLLTHDPKIAAYKKNPVKLV